MHCTFYDHSTSLLVFFSLIIACNKGDVELEIIKYKRAHTIKLYVSAILIKYGISQTNKQDERNKQTFYTKWISNNGCFLDQIKRFKVLRGWKVHSTQQNPIKLKQRYKTSKLYPFFLQEKNLRRIFEGNSRLSDQNNERMKFKPVSLLYDG